MDNDVSVTRLPDDDWNDRGLPGPGSRFRVVAVMGAVVIGCLVAALVVGITGGGFDEHDERAIVALPEATSGVAGPDTTPTTEVTFTTGNPEGGGTPVQATTTSSAASTSTTTTTSSSTTTTTTSVPTSSVVTTTTTAQPDPIEPDPSQPGGPTTSQPTPPNSPPPTTPTEPDDDDCWWIFCL
ncbi:hypothetical protein [Prauserella muralis]|uniref:Uncharacterized protein n=1 Tax=Prauserella muralis TaxID=588067 RepID=A0A2V4AZC5_9PSEU|nr:hypothetical protein [Prauserella muralis]PXY27340.1 hypothetical protein BAY60_12915 [Prauserella muralis]TWE22978.1 hypothetical protein FHX69_4236 [Prauserella muralis]